MRPVVLYYNKEYCKIMHKTIILDVQLISVLTVPYLSSFFNVKSTAKCCNLHVGLYSGEACGVGSPSASNALW